MTPQTVNAYYNPPMNEIVFPAAILQPPFFNVTADDAVNYGAIGAVIGHEISHGFDDQGRKYDGHGNLRDWWTAAGRRASSSSARQGVVRAVRRATARSPGMHVNGELTLGENIARSRRASPMAYRAYQLSLQGKAGAGDRRLHRRSALLHGLGARSGARKYRDDDLRRRLLTDPHSPSEYRTNVIVTNLPEFYRAFDVKPGDKLYRAGRRARENLVSPKELPHALRMLHDLYDRSLSIAAPVRLRLQHAAAADEQVKAAWSEVLNQYQRRADLVPNLVNVVKGAAAQEKQGAGSRGRGALARRRHPGDARADQRPKPPSSSSRRRRASSPARCRDCWPWSRTIPI